MEYNVEQKRHWRYWVWKRIAEHCKVHPRFATVLFLAGPSPLDLEAAKKYGFRLENIVAVDKDEACVKEARRNGCTAIQGSLHEVVAKWTDGIIHGIVADYCGGLTLDTAVESYQLCAAANVVALNFQRGRERDLGGKVLRKFCRTVNRVDQFDMFVGIMLAVLPGLYKTALDKNSTDQEYRDAAWKIAVFQDISLRYMEATASSQAFLESERAEFLEEFIMSVKTDEVNSAVRFLQDTNSRMSYRSNRVIMDSAVIPKTLCCSGSQAMDGQPLRSRVDSRLAAMKAIRTMNGAVRFAAANN